MAKLPPGPRIAAYNALRYMRDPYGFYQELRDRYGDPITVATMFGTLVTTGNPAGVKEIFTAPPETYGVFGSGALSLVVGDQSLLQTDGPVHASRRKLMMPMFHGERMHAYGEQFKAITRRHAGRLRQGQAFSMQEFARQVTVEVIIQSVFGITEPERVDRWASALDDVMQLAKPSLIFLPFLRHDLLSFGAWGRYLAARRRVDELIASELQERRSSGRRGSDILSMLLDARFDDGSAMSDGELRDQLITLLVAGHETTSIAIAWIFYWLERHPEVRQRLLDELAALGPDPDSRMLAKLPYLDAVCHETLRLNPIVPDVGRTLKRPMTLLGYEIPAGYSVAVSTTLLHRNPELYPEPERFRPERFLERTYTPFEFTPFGGGERRCIGAAFALYEMKHVVATLLQEFALRRTSEAPLQAVRRGVIMVPRGGVEMVLSR